jgi:hypothetical protein
MPALRRALLEYHVGSILNVGTSAHSLQRWQHIITTIQDVATKETRLGIPVIYGIDAVHGAGYTLGATLFPQHLGMAATWDPELVRKEAEVTASEIRACGIPWNFSPVLDIGRQPLWPRLWETFGEDPYLASTMARARGGWLWRRCSGCVRQTLPRLQLSAHREGPYACLDPRAHAPRVLRSSLSSGNRGGGQNGHGKFLGDQWHPCARQLLLPERSVAG